MARRKLMSPRKRLSRRSKAGPGRPGGTHPENTTAYPQLEGHLEPNTAALMDGAPPGGMSGRTGPDPDPKAVQSQQGPSETDTKHLPG